MVDISREKCERISVETIVDSDGTLLLNEKHIEEEFNHKNFGVTTIKIIQHSTFNFLLSNRIFCILFDHDL